MEDAVGALPDVEDDAEVDVADGDAELVLVNATGGVEVVEDTEAEVRRVLEGRYEEVMVAVDKIDELEMYDEVLIVDVTSSEVDKEVPEDSAIVDDDGVL
ncbi:hypothetical protein EIP91_003029 [Steccherinum ochraceum]|uniref:Uncharacterized protein n=1 Tax=Steccherinum ochraceum TaxID=92696 RepID=A0A4R0REL9_9APHY|nr:hypothetical protein EIP91_003029 [Steccherinum ochraceum]